MSKKKPAKKSPTEALIKDLASALEFAYAELRKLNPVDEYPSIRAALEKAKGRRS